MGYSRSDLSSIRLASIKGLSASFVEKAAMVDIETVDDLLNYYPRRYIDRTRQVELGELFPGEEATFYATVEAISSRRTRNRKALVEAVVSDGNSRVKVTFFNQAWRVKQLKVGTQAAFFGKLDEYRGNPQIVNPVVDVIREGAEADRTSGIIPIYSQSGKAELSTWNVRTAMDHVIAYAEQLDDILDDDTKEELKLFSRGGAYKKIHQPEDNDDMHHSARRLRFDEFLMLQMVLVGRFLQSEKVLLSNGCLNNSLEEQLLQALPFSLTKGQQSAIAEIDEDMTSTHPMHRLLQGDVGSGKTVVALAAAMRAVGSGAQVVIMAPTEVLAQQHLRSARILLAQLEVEDDTNLFANRPVSIELLTNTTSAKDRERIESAVKDGSCDVLISTHAVLYNDWPFNNLGLIVVDEQHRFGVEQRSALLTRSEKTPHMLVMSATPIPRTAAMLYFGDLKSTIMKDMPEGRKPVDTSWARSELEVFGAYERVRMEITAGHQAYVVCPLVSESDKVEAKSVMEHVEHLRENELKDLRVGVIHGQMKSAEKDVVMGDFISGDLDVLVSTTVIEVGVDVPNATVMVIEDADRFGLSQLHQLRGRVGRGGEQAFCFLCSYKQTPDVIRRLEAMESTTDGFELAEIDLELRGAGHVLGQVQSGSGDLKLGRLPRDAKYIEFARDVAMKKLTEDPQMMLPENKVLAAEMRTFLDENDIDFLFKS
jgi:ATP-dependent DNA helicase RecG